jgi:hypothetical protein
VNEENVLRFRHECFLMKNLSHPNVVQLVGVCWSEDLFACLLEYVQNGSLEDWLRRTVGGKVYVPPKKPVIGKKKKQKKKKGPSLAEVTYKGFDYDKTYNEAEHTDTDKARKAEAEKLGWEWWSQRYNPKYKFKPIVGKGGAPLELNVQGFHTYDDEAHIGMGIGHCIVRCSVHIVLRQQSVTNPPRPGERPAEAGVRLLQRPATSGHTGRDRGARIDADGEHRVHSRAHRSQDHLRPGGPLPGCENAGEGSRRLRLLHQPRIQHR